MWYFNVLPPSTICPTNCGEQVVTLYCTVQYYSCADTQMNYGWMDWKLTIWKHKLCMSATQESNRRVISLSLHCYYNTQHILLQFLLYYIISVLQFKYTRSLLPNTNLLIHLEFLCSNCYTFATQFKTTLFFTPQYLERQSNQPQKRDGKSDKTEAHTI